MLFSNSVGELYLHTEDTLNWTPDNDCVCPLDPYFISILYYWLEGNGSCDCNRRIKFIGKLNENVPCTATEYKILEINFGGQNIPFIDFDFYETLNLNTPKGK